ncbi:fungal-specific transcription factor domain-containing protein, partial [Endogone sp. FLAS-F59071]
MNTINPVDAFRYEDPLQSTRSKERPKNICSNCRRLKIRCDGERPCSSCKHRTAECNYLEKRKKTCQSPDNGNAAKKNQQSFPFDVPDREVILTPQVNVNQNNTAVTNSQHQQQFNDNAGQLAIDETGSARFVGGSSGFHFLQKSCQFRNGAFYFPCNDPEKSSSFQFQTFHQTELHLQDIPPKDLSDQLIELYFEYHQPILPVFENKMKFMKALEENRCSHFALNALYAVASRFSKDPRVRLEPGNPETAGNIFFERAKHLLKDDNASSSISTIQGLILMAVHQNDLFRPTRACKYAGMAFFMAQNLGLYRSCELWNLPPSECERRARVFWCCYVLDRILSATYGMPVTFDDHNIDYSEALPIQESNTQELPEEMQEGPSVVIKDFVHVIHLCKILGRILRTFYWKSGGGSTAISMDETYTRLNNDLIDWQEHLPQHLRDFSSTNVCQLHMMYHTITILLHRPFIQDQKRPVLSPSSSLWTCTEAADAIFEIITDLMNQPNRIRVLTSLTTYYVFTAGIILIYNLNLIDARFSAKYKSKVSKVIEALQIIQRTWVLTAWPQNILSELVGLNCSKEPEVKVQRQTIEQSSLGPLSYLDDFSAVSPGAPQVSLEHWTWPLSPEVKAQVPVNTQDQATVYSYESRNDVEQTIFPEMNTNESNWQLGTNFQVSGSEAAMMIATSDRRILEAQHQPNQEPNQYESLTQNVTQNVTLAKPDLTSKSINSNGFHAVAELQKQNIASIELNLK